jgi:hypothetical protein
MHKWMKRYSSKGREMKTNYGGAKPLIGAGQTHSHTLTKYHKMTEEADLLFQAAQDGLTRCPIRVLHTISEGQSDLSQHVG